MTNKEEIIKEKIMKILEKWIRRPISYSDWAEEILELFQTQNQDLTKELSWKCSRIVRKDREEFIKDLLKLKVSHTKGDFYKSINQLIKRYE